MTNNRLMYYMLNFSFSGIKNIEKKIRFDFYKKTVDKSFDPSDYRVKAIYGENGSGKTAIITAIRLLKDLITNPRYLDDSKTQEFLDHIVNKNRQRVELETEIIIIRNEAHVLRYKIELEKTSEGFYEIVSESLERKSGQYANNKYRSVFVVSNGEIQKLYCSKNAKNELKKITTNRLATRTLITYYQNLLNNVLDSLSDLKSDSDLSRDQLIDISSVGEFILLTVLFFNTSIYMDEEDTHNLYFIRKTLENVRKQVDKAKIDDWFGQGFLDSISVDSELVSKAEFEQFKKKIKKMEAFIRIFKSDLDSISIDKRDDGENYRCRLIMNYPSYSIDTEFESTGIRKLIRLYDCLAAAGNGGIVFIDELDSNINDVYLCKLIEYFMYYGEGQLCFTTHNVDPMDYLKDYKNSIDFLSSINTVYSWNSRGNASPGNAYRNGQIEDLPFNIDAIDFVGLFEEEQ